MRRFLFASLRTHARRYIAVAIAVVIACTFMVATNALGAAARDGWHNAIAAEFAGADAVLTDIAPATQRQLREANDVAAVSTVRTSFGEVSTGDLRATASLGTVADAPALRWQQLTTGDYPRTKREVLINADRASAANVGVGDPVTIDSNGRSWKLRIAGIVEPSNGTIGSSFYLTESMARQAIADTGMSLITVAMRDAAAPAQLRDATNATVQGVDAYVREQQLNATGDVDVMQQMMYVFVGIALLVAALVIANTMSIVLAQRARDFALLRCVGALRRQIVRTTLLETIVIATAAALLGVIAGWGVGAAGVWVLRDTVVGVEFAQPSPALADALLPVLLAVGVAVAAALVPARRIGRLSPLAALRPDPPITVRSRPGVVRIAIATGLIVLGAAGLLLGSVAGVLAVAMAGGAISFSGVLLLGPVLVPAAIALVRPFVGRVAGVPGRLAAANAIRQRRRTAATSAALLIGVTLISTVVVGTASMKSSLATEMDTRAPLDMTVTADHGLDAGLSQRVAEIDGVDEAVALDGAPVSLRGKELTAVGMDAAAAEVVRPHGELRGLAADQLLVPLDNASGLTEGERVRVRGDDGNVRLEVVHASGIGDTAVVAASVLERLDTTSSVRAVWLRANDGADPETVVGELNTLAQDANATVDGSLLERASVMSAMDIVLAVTVGLLGVAALIAVIGVGNTLSLSVLERLRENALLRALGLRRAQQRLMLAIESLLIAGVAGVLGVGLGMLYGWFGVRTLVADAFVTTPSVTVPVGQLLIVLAVAAVAGLLASVLPARRAVRIAPAAGLAME